MSRILLPFVASMALSALFAPVAEARISGPRLDSVSIQCGAMQDESDQLVAEYKNASDARREEILTRLRQIGRDWNEICKGVFGDISMRVLPALDLRQDQIGAPLQTLDPGDQQPVRPLPPRVRLPGRRLAPAQ